MRNLFIFLAGILIILWAVGFFVFGSGNMIHILPLLALASVMKGLIKEDDVVYMKKNHTWKAQD
jgi:hypothetical protein